MPNLDPCTASIVSIVQHIVYFNQNAKRFGGGKNLAEKMTVLNYFHQRCSSIRRRKNKNKQKQKRAITRTCTYSHRLQQVKGGTRSLDYDSVLTSRFDQLAKVTAKDWWPRSSLTHFSQYLGPPHSLW